MNVQPLLQRIGDVAGVIGSLVSDEQGELIDALMPAELSPAELRRTASRLASIVRCAELCEMPVEQCELCHGHHRLLVKRFTGGLLAVVLERSASSQRALQMALTVALEALPGALAARDARAPRTPVEDEPTSRYSFAEGELHVADDAARPATSPRVIPRQS